MTLCVPPKEALGAVAQSVLPLLDRACRRADASQSAAELLSFCALRDDFDLWVEVADGRVTAAGATQMQEAADGSRRIVLLAAGGDVGLRRLVEIARQVEAVGRANGARTARIEGRPGWARLLDYEIVGTNERGGVVMERKL